MRNIEFVTSKASTTQVFLGATSFGIKVDEENGNYVIGIYGEDLYDDELNIISYQGVVYSWMYSGNLIFSNNSITSFNPKTPFHAVDRNDSSWLSGLSMPSYKYIDLTWGTSGTNYTAPANGWFFAGRQTTTDSFAYMNVYVVDQNFGVSSVQLSKNLWLRGYVPVRRGDTIGITFGTGSNASMLKFYYTEGEQ